MDKGNVQKLTLLSLMKNLKEPLCKGKCAKEWGRGILLVRARYALNKARKLTLNVVMHDDNLGCLFSVFDLFTWVVE